MALQNYMLPGGIDTHIPTFGSVVGTAVDVVRGAIAGGAQAAAQDIAPQPVETIYAANGSRLAVDPQNALTSHAEFARFTTYVQQQFQRVYTALQGVSSGGGGGFGDAGGISPLLMILLLGGTTSLSSNSDLLLLLAMSGGMGGGFGGGGFGGGGDNSALLMVLLLGGTI